MLGGNKMIKSGSYYKTLKGDIGKCVSAYSLNEFIEDMFDFDDWIILYQLEFPNDRIEFWLSNQIEEIFK